MSASLVHLYGAECEQCTWATSMVKEGNVGLLAEEIKEHADLFPRHNVGRARVYLVEFDVDEDENSTYCGSFCTVHPIMSRTG